MDKRQKNGTVGEKNDEGGAKDKEKTEEGTHEEKTTIYGVIKEIGRFLSHFIP